MANAQVGTNAIFDFYEECALAFEEFGCCILLCFIFCDWSEHEDH